ncbi:MAG: hypothetical protein ABII00_07330 [Elusimicrobiota bacterium]
MKNRRSKLLIEPRFQRRLMLRLTGWVLLSTILTAGVLYLFLAIADQQAAGEFFYIVQEPGSHPELLSRTQIVLPAMVTALVINLVLTLAFSLYYSQKLAGPIHRIIHDMTKLTEGGKMKAAFRLRGNDEFQDVGKAFDALLKKLAELGFVEKEEA